MIKEVIFAIVSLCELPAHDVASGQVDKTQGDCQTRLARCNKEMSMRGLYKCLADRKLGYVDDRTYNK